MKEKVTHTGEIKLRRAKVWQIGLFALNNTATNIFLFLMMYVSYYATGFVGLGTVLVSTIITGSRIFDGFTDPIIGLWIDKTNGRFGKFRPFMLTGYLVMSTVTLVMFSTTHLVPENFRVIYFITLYAIYIIGYTFQTAVTKAGQSVITTDPSQRPLFSTFDISFTALLSAGVPLYLSSYLVPQYGGFTNSVLLFREFVITVVIIAGILTICAIAGIWSSDRREYFGTGETVKISLKDMYEIIKGNRPLKMLIIAASTDKLGFQVASNSVVMVMLFGIVIGDYSLYGTLAGIMMIPNVIIVLFGTRFASKFGTKKGYVASTWLSMIAFALIFLVLLLGDPTQIRLSSMNFITIAFIAFYVFGQGVRTLSGGLVIPLIPDVIDYETYRTGRYAPGVMGTIFSFVDKMVSSLSQTVIGLSLAMIGFKDVFPDINTPYTPALFGMTMFLFIGLLMAAWISSLIAMKFYDLDKDRMKEIQMELEQRRITNSQKNENIA